MDEGHLLPAAQATRSHSHFVPGTDSCSAASSADGLQLCIMLQLPPLSMKNVTRDFTAAPPLIANCRQRRPSGSDASGLVRKEARLQRHTCRTHAKYAHVYPACCSFWNVTHRCCTHQHLTGRRWYRYCTRLRSPVPAIAVPCAKGTPDLALATAPAVGRRQAAAAKTSACRRNALLIGPNMSSSQTPWLLKLSLGRLSVIPIPLRESHVSGYLNQSRCAVT
jgi:crotonobetainyl-CoA:carnitine CoA-transferase CaiB-like acyl-CoA transferase